ncbi:hypothetical protein [Spirosoma rigui]|uniref:hypothetical protein n=1 Tax=Spirosoma rigui TaxID=564064 RepID=UPI0009B14035|nr:hypothetical protein [Spirosoma rigui]
MNELKQTLSSVTYQLRANALIRSALVSASAYLLVAAFSGSTGVSLLAALLGFGVGVVLTKPFQDKKPEAIELIHQTVGDTEYSLPLLDKPHLNIAEQLQLERLGERARDIQVPGVLLAQAGSYAMALLVAVVIYSGYPLIRPTKTPDPRKLGVQRAALPDDKPAVPPAFESATVQIQPPAYTRLPVRKSGDLNVVALVGSQLSWQIRFSDTRHLSVRLVNSRAQELPFRMTANGFTHQDRLLNSGIYAIKAYWRTPAGRDSVVYQSDFYRLEATPDLAPKIEPESKELYRYHFLKDPKTMTIAAKISDDFSVTNAFIVATVARGSGENVKFREVRMPLSPANFRQATLRKVLDLRALNFAPGDELYYYWAAVDNRQPEANFTKSDTYFIVYKDTTKVEDSELATMAVNIMPEYFRSQRQIIIDTEKLIAKRKKLADHPFKSTSNEIGFDQKVLRLRYGQFLGEEFETSAGGGHIEPTNENGDPLAGFVHDHDKGEGDEHEPGHKDEIPHEAHDHDHEHAGGNDNQDPIAALMEQYVHAHDNAETNTFHEQSTRSLLKMALEQMWQSELHLRMYEPEKALPYEQKALDYLKLSQQKARSYVKKTGFDPPPIKEKELRLTGELKDVPPTFSQNRTIDPQRIAPLVADVVGFLDLPTLTQPQRQTVQLLGNALANRAINNGLQSWSVLASLQKLAGGRALSAPEKSQLKTKLYGLTNPSERTGRSYTSDKTLERAFWQQLK